MIGLPDSRLVEKRKREEVIKETTQFLKGLVREAGERVRSTEQNLSWIQYVQAYWKQGDPLPNTMFCHCESIDDEEEKLKQLQYEIEYLEDELKKEKADLQLWEKELKDLQEDEEEDDEEEENDESKAKRHKIQDFNAYVDGIGR